MALINWNPKIVNYRGPFLPWETLEAESHVLKLLKGTATWEPTGQDVERGLPEYEDRIEEIRRQCQQQERAQKDLADMGQKVEQQRQAECELWVAGFERPLKYPRVSTWSEQQQRFVVDQLVKYWASGIPTNPPRSQAGDVHKLMSLLEQMKQEQDEFFTFVRQVNEKQLGRYRHKHRDIEAYMRKRLLTDHSRVRLYPAFYRPVKMLALVPPPETPPTLQHLGEPLELGEVPVLVVPMMRCMTSVKRQMKFLDVFHPSTGAPPRLKPHTQRDREAIQAQDGKPTLWKTPVSVDPNVTRLAAALDFQYVLTPSVVKILLENAPAWDRQWEVPVTVREVPCRQPGRTRRVVFLDKPLPARCIGSLEKQTMALKRMLRILTCKRHAGGNVDYSQTDRTAEKRKLAREQIKERKKKAKNKKKKTAGAAEGVSSAAGDGPHAAPAAVAVPAMDVSSDSGDDSTDDEGLQIDCGEAESNDEASDAEAPAEEADAVVGGALEGADLPSPTGPATPADTAPKSSEGPPSALKPGSSLSLDTSSSATLQRQSQVPDSGAITPVFRPQVDQPPGPQLVQHSSTAPGPQLVEQGGSGFSSSGAVSGPQPSRPNGSDGGVRAAPQDRDFVRPPLGLNTQYRVWKLGQLQMLVRCSTHGMRENPVIGSLVRYSVHPKPAYQPSYGIEVMTRTEVVRQWVDCLLRPDSRVLRVHVDPITLMVITPEERTLPQLADEFIKYDTKFRPQHGLQVLESILRELTCLEPGQYLLSHDSRSGAFVRLTRADHSAVDGYRLHQSFVGCPREALVRQPLCLNIDPSVLTPYNIRYGRVPATFNYVKRGDLSWRDYWKKQNEQGVKRKRLNKGTKKKAQKN